MKPQTLFAPLISLVMAIVLLTACVAPAAVPTPTPVPPTATPIPPTPTPEPSTDTPISSTRQDYEIVEDISYQENGSDYARERSELDIYLPQGREDFPVFVWFHGGSLQYESKREFYATSVARRLATEGIGVVLPNYRLSPRAEYPAYIEDAASAFAWVYQNIAHYGGDPERLLLGGHSSGAYLAAMIATDESYLKQHGLASEQIAGVVTLSGQMFGDSTVWGEHGVSGPVDEAMVDEKAPMFHVRVDVPPFLSMCADSGGDPIEESICEQNQRFVDALRETGHENASFIEIPDRSHLSISRMDTSNDLVVELILSFVSEATRSRSAPSP